MSKLASRAATLVALAGFLAAVSAQDSPPWPPPSLRAEQYGSAVVGGVLLGTVASIGVLVKLIPGLQDDPGVTPAMIAFPALGYTCGAALGVCAAGDAVRYGGSGWWSLAGALAGGAAGAVPALLTGQNGWYSLSVVLAPAGAVAGYNIVPSRSAIAGARFAAPSLSVAADPAGVAFDFRPVNIRF